MNAASLADLLECAVCLEQLKRTCKVLPCQHTFCRKCLEDIVSSQSELRCPECRTLVAKKIDDLPANILLVRLLDRIKSCKYTSSLSSGKTICAQDLPMNSYDGEASNTVDVLVPLPQIPQCRTLYDFNPDKKGKDCLSFRKNETLHVIRKVDENWLECEKCARIGILPLVYVEMHAVSFQLNNAARQLLSSEPSTDEFLNVSVTSLNSLTITSCIGVMPTTIPKLEMLREPIFADPLSLLGISIGVGTKFRPTSHHFYDSLVFPCDSNSSATGDSIVESKGLNITECSLNTSQTEISAESPKTVNANRRGHTVKRLLQSTRLFDSVRTIPANGLKDDDFDSSTYSCLGDCTTCCANRQSVDSKLENMDSVSAELIPCYSRVNWKLMSDTDKSPLMNTDMCGYASISMSPTKSSLSASLLFVTTSSCIMSECSVQTVGLCSVENPFITSRPLATSNCLHSMAKMFPAHGTFTASSCFNKPMPLPRKSVASVLCSVAEPTYAPSECLSLFPLCSVGKPHSSAMSISLCSLEKITSAIMESTAAVAVCYAGRPIFTLKAFDVSVPLCSIDEHISTPGKSLSPFPLGSVGEPRASAISIPNCSMDKPISTHRESFSPFPLCSVGEPIPNHRASTISVPLCSLDRPISTHMESFSPFPLCTARKPIPKCRASAMPVPLCSLDRPISAHRESFSPFPLCTARKPIPKCRASAMPVPLCSLDRPISTHRESFSPFPLCTARKPIPKCRASAMPVPLCSLDRPISAPTKSTAAVSLCSARKPKVSTRACSQDTPRVSTTVVPVCSQKIPTSTLETSVGTFPLSSVIRQRPKCKLSATVPCFDTLPTRQASQTVPDQRHVKACGRNSSNFGSPSMLSPLPVDKSLRKQLSLRHCRAHKAFLSLERSDISPRNSSEECEGFTTPLLCTRDKRKQNVNKSKSIKLLANKGQPSKLLSKSLCENNGSSLIQQRILFHMIQTVQPKQYAV